MICRIKPKTKHDPVTEHKSRDYSFFGPAHPFIFEKLTGPVTEGKAQVDGRNHFEIKNEMIGLGIIDNNTIVINFN